jgi:hypothetical protein
MKNPCKECLVSARCSEICSNRALYIYNHPPSDETKKYLNSLTEEQALKYILVCENILKNIEKIDPLDDKEFK